MAPVLLVVGASAGGVEALRALVAGLPAALPAAVLVTVHVGDRQESHLPQILSRSGPLPAEHARDGQPVEAGRILVAPADRHLMVRDGRVVLSRGPRVNRYRPSVDVMFGSAARAGGPSVIGAVLSGALDDGAVGAALIDSRGGVVAVQDPDDAGTDSMPRAALTAVPHAIVASAADLGPQLAALVHKVIGEGVSMIERDDEPAAGQTMSESAGPGSLAGDESAALRVACPDCGGVLARIDLPRITYFRCHVGHQYSPLTLERAQRERAENALWTAVAALEEHAVTARFVATNQPETDADRAGYVRAAERSDAVADAVRSRIDRTADA
ncbi:chemotaxis protein CheB [Pseudonocardia sp. CA-107938]|uniref:chemotaxis protein CheB n=1 Tax=Pseudonocardia sp. CA-107938 TaxID=3240021 RepID=UPI003D8F3454